MDTEQLDDLAQYLFRKSVSILEALKELEIDPDIVDLEEIEKTLWGEYTMMRCPHCTYWIQCSSSLLNEPFYL